MPRHVHTLWERGRYVEYLFAFTFYKPVQDLLGRPLISSGCFSVYRTDVLREYGGWPTRTLAEGGARLGALGAVDVNANQTNPSTFTSGGVIEFQPGATPETTFVTNPTIAIQGSCG